MRVSGNNPDAKSVGAAFCRRNGPFINVISVAARAAPLGEHSDGRISQRVILGFAMVGLDSHVFRIDCTEMYLGRDLKRIAHRNFLPVLIPDLHLANSYLRPVLSHLRFPLT